MRATILIFVALAPAHECAYNCSANGTECTSASRIYSAGVYQVRGTLESACTANPLCYQYDWDETGGVGFQCSSTVTRVDHPLDEFGVCVKQWAAGATFSDGTALKAAVNEWLAKASAAEEEHGHITNWNTSMVESMDNLFDVRCAARSAQQRFPRLPPCLIRAWQDAFTFNLQLAWDTSRVTSMKAMFSVRFTPPPIAPGSTPPRAHHPHHTPKPRCASPPGHASSGRTQGHSTNRSRGTPRG